MVRLGYLGKAQKDPYKEITFTVPKSRSSLSDQILTVILRFHSHHLPYRSQVHIFIAYRSHIRFFVTTSRTHIGDSVGSREEGFGCRTLRLVGGASASRKLSRAYSLPLTRVIAYLINFVFRLFGPFFFVLFCYMSCHSAREYERALGMSVGVWGSF